MSDYIKKEEATSIPVISKEHRKYFNSLDDAFETGWNEALACVNMIPSANVVEVVRCKDCKHHEDFLSDDGDKVLCWVHDVDIVMAKNDYCSYGEKKEK